MKPDLKGYLFNITAAELLVAQSLGQQFRFVFVNTLSGEYQEMSLNEVFARSRAMYPAWHIRF
jgi:fumarate hydratase class II